MPLKTRPHCPLQIALKQEQTVANYICVYTSRSHRRMGSNSGNGIHCGQPTAERGGVQSSGTHSVLESDKPSVRLSKILDLSGISKRPTAKPFCLSCITALTLGSWDLAFPTSAAYPVTQLTWLLLFPSLCRAFKVAASYPQKRGHHPSGRAALWQCSAFCQCKIYLGTTSCPRSHIAYFATGTRQLELRSAKICCFQA